MNNMARRLKQMLTILLAVSMLAGTIPVNVFAAETETFLEETQTVAEENGDENLQIVEEVPEDNKDSGQQSGTDDNSGSEEPKNTGDSRPADSKGEDNGSYLGDVEDENTEGESEDGEDGNTDGQPGDAESGNTDGQPGDAEGGNTDGQPGDAESGNTDGQPENNKTESGDSVGEDNREQPEDGKPEEDGNEPGNVEGEDGDGEPEDEKEEVDDNQTGDVEEEEDGSRSEDEKEEVDENQSGDLKEEDGENQDSDKGTLSDNSMEDGEAEDSVSGNQLAIFSDTELEEGNKYPVTFTFSIDGTFDETPIRIFRLTDKGIEKEIAVEKSESASVYMATYMALPKEVLKFKLEGIGQYKVVDVADGYLNPDSSGVYTLTVEKDKTVEVTMKRLESYEVTFKYDPELVYGLNVKMNTDDVRIEDSNVVSNTQDETVIKIPGMTEDSVVSFELYLDESAKVDSVKTDKGTSNEETVKAVEGSIYTYALNPLEKEVTVTIETSLDPKKCNILDIHIWGHSDSISVKCGDQKYGSGNNRLLTKDEEERITLHVDSNYIVEKVLLNDVEETIFGTYAELDVNFSDIKTQKLVIYTIPKQSVEERKIVFANQSSNITYKINTKAPMDAKKTIVKKDPIKQNTYIVNANESLVEFSVTYKEGYKPKVTFLSDGKVDEVLYDVTSEGNTDTYSLALATLGNEETPGETITEVIIEEIPEIRTVSIVYDEKAFSRVDAIVDGKYVELEEDEDGTVTYTSVYGTQLLLQIETTDDFVLGFIEETSGKKVSKVNVGKKSYSYTINVNSDKTIKLGLKGVYTAKVYDGEVNDSSELEAENKVYTVEAERKYIFLLYHGKKRQAVEAAVLKSGNKELSLKPGVEDTYYVHFVIPANQAGKTLTLETTCKEGTKDYTHKTQFKVLPKAKITKIAGVSSGKMSQTADTVKEYAITCNLPVNAENFGAEVVTAVAEDQIWDENTRQELNEEAQKWFSAEIIDNKLKITVKTSEKDKKARIKIYDVVKSTETGKKQYVEGGTFTVTTTAPALVTATPTVSLKSATNLELVLSLGMKNLQEIKNGEYWYKVEGTPKYGKEPAAELTDNTGSFVEYIKYTASTQVESIRVVDRAKNGLAKDDLQQTEGNGQQTEGDTPTPLAEGDFPYKADYNIKVTLVQTKNENWEQGNESDVSFVSKTTKEVAVSTKVPSYETNLSVKTVKTTLYSGQQNIIVATPVFSKNTSYQEITAESLQEGILVTVDETDNIIASVDKAVKPGKYTIDVTAKAAVNTLPSKKSFTIEVVQGIYALTLETPKELYKEYNKAVTFKTNLIYNEGDAISPKTKKVEWGLAIKENDEWVDIDKEHPYAKFVTIKDGKVTIDKSFVVSNNPEKNKFYVKATAKDFVREEGEELTVYSNPIEITNVKMFLGELVLVKKTNLESDDWEVVARSGSKVSVDQVAGSRLAILKKGTPERDKYHETDFEVMEEGLLTYASSNKNLKITECTQDRNYRTIETEGIASKVQLTVTAADGSNVKTVLNNLTVTYADAGDIGVVVTQGEKDEITVMDSFTSETKQFYGAKDTVLRVKIQQKNENGRGERVYGSNYTLKAQGAKIVESDQLKGEHTIVGTADTIVLQLTNNTRKVTKKFTLQNGSLVNEEVKKNKAITLKAEGTLKTGEFSEVQTITYTLPKGSIGKHTHALVTVDTLDSMDKKKKANYDSLVLASQKTIGDIQRISSDGKITITFKPAEGESTYTIPEQNFTYKLNIAVGTMNDYYEFKADVKPNAVTIKTTVTKIVDAKLNATYNMSVKEGAEVTLTLNNKKATLVSVGEENQGAVDALVNRNINGRENKFAEFFEVVKAGDGIFKIRLKAGVEVSAIGTNDWKGYINQYTYTDGTKQKTVYNTAVEIKPKDLLLKYSLTKAVVLKGKDEEATINTHVSLMAGSDVVKAKYVYMPLVKVSGNWKEQMFDAKVDDLDGSLKLTAKPQVSVYDATFSKEVKQDVKIAASNTGTLYVVPEYSYYDATLEPLWEAVKTPPKENDPVEAKEAYKQAMDAYAKAMETYGIKLTATVEVKEKTKATGKIKVTNTKPKYAAENFVTANTDNLVNNADPKEGVNLIVGDDQILDLTAEYSAGTYVLTVPYIKVADCDVVAVSNESENSLVRVEKTDGDNSVTLTLDKNALRESRKYGKAVIVKAVFDFGGGIKEETVSFTVTLPKQPVQLKAVIESLKKVAWADLNVEYKKRGEDGKIVENQYLNKDEMISVNRHLIEEKINAVLGKDGDLVVSIQGNAKVPQLESEGYITYNIKVRDLVTGEKSNLGEIATIPLDKLLTSPTDLAGELDSAIAYWNRITLTNLNTPTEIINNIRKRVLTRNGDVIHKHLRLYATDITYTAATEESAGVIGFTVQIVNVADSEDKITRDLECTIPKLFTMDEAKKEIEDAVQKNIIIYNSDLSNAAKKKEKVDKILEEAQRVLKGQDYFVEVKRGSELMGTPADGEIPGSASIELTLVKLTTSRISENITCDFEVQQGGRMSLLRYSKK